MHAICVNLQPELLSELRGPLTTLSIALDENSASDRGIEAALPADIIFCSSNLETVKALREACPAAAVIVVSRVPDISEWLDCIEAGAADYCSAPFELVQMQWVIDSSLRSTRQIIAA